MAAEITSATHLLVHDDDERLVVSCRHNTGYRDGSFSVIARHIEPEKSAREAMRREAKEEAGIDIDIEDLEYVHTMQRRKSDGTMKLDIFFRCTQWSG